MAYLTSKEILSADNFQYEEVDCPEWGGVILLRGLSARDADKYTAMLTRGGKGGTYNLSNFRAKLVAMCAVDAKGGKRIFTDDQVDALGKQCAAPLIRCYDVAMRISALSKADVEEIEENLGETPNEDSDSI